MPVSHFRWMRGAPAGSYGGRAMSHSTLTPVFVGLRTGLHALFAVLLALVVVRAVVAPGPRLVPIAVVLALCAVFGLVYVLGARVARVAPRDRALAGAAWVLVLSALWVALLAVVPDAAYLVFPLFFVYLHVLPRVIGPVVVLVATAVGVVAVGVHSGFTTGGVVGPLVGAGVALLIGLGHRALAREAAEREALLAELVATRDALAATEREQGVLAERARLAREIHDTVAQGLSSIQMLLHAAERADPEHAGVEHLRLARRTAAANLAEARRFVRELTPPTLDQGLVTALQRLAASHERTHGQRVEVAVDAGPGGRPEHLAALPMEVQTALLRTAQGALANTAQHARAGVVRLVLSGDSRQVRLVVDDDGAGFDPSAARAAASDSFGLQAIAERAAQLGGHLDVDSAPGRGTRLAVQLPLVVA